MGALAKMGFPFSQRIPWQSKSENAIAVRLSRPLRRPLYRYVYNPATIQTDAEARLISYGAARRDVGDSVVDRRPGQAVAI